MTDRVGEKSVVVTAAGQGIGRAAAPALADEAARVLATALDVRAAQEVAHEHANIMGHRLDFLDPEAVAAICDDRGSLDALVNCAGIVHDGSVLDCTDAEWDVAFDLNAKAMFRLSRAVLPAMLNKQGGSITNIASVASSIKGVPRRRADGASKAAMIGLTRSIAAVVVHLASDESAFTSGQALAVDGGWTI